ncbi:MAG: J domain-containing protein [bacterium]|nr:J domain-containing protein [bacterium]
MIRLLLVVAFILALVRVVRTLLRPRVPAPPPGAWDPWAVLGVPRGASRDEITRAHREQMKRYHPDRVADLGPELQQLAHEKTVALQRAYDELTRG